MNIQPNFITRSKFIKQVELHHQACSCLQGAFTCIGRSFLVKRYENAWILVAKRVDERTREDLTAIKSDIRMWCRDSRSTLASRKTWRLQKPFSIWNHHGACRYCRSQSKFNNLSVIKACERPWNCNFSYSDLTRDLDNDRRFTASSRLHWIRIGILWLGKVFKPEVRFYVSERTTTVHVVMKSSRVEGDFFKPEN